MKLKDPANILAIILITALFISSCSASQPIRTKMQQLRVGMTQEQVTQLLERNLINVTSTKNLKNGYIRLSTLAMYQTNIK